MTKRVIPPVPQKTVYSCDRCGEDGINPKVEAKVNKEDWHGNYVAGETVHLCRSCGSEFQKWMET